MKEGDNRAAGREMVRLHYFHIRFGNKQSNARIHIRSSIAADREGYTGR